jgi:flagellar hook-length control protein FliK
MTQTTTDYLYTIPPQVPDRGFVTNPRERDNSIDDHLSQASSNASGDYRSDRNLVRRAPSDGSIAQTERKPNSEDDSRQPETAGKAAPEKNSADKQQQSTPAADDARPAAGDHKDGEVDHGGKKGDHEKHDPKTAELVATAHLATQVEAKKVTSERGETKVTTESITTTAESSKQGDASSRKIAIDRGQPQLQPADKELAASDNSEEASVTDAASNQQEKTSATKQSKQQKAKAVSRIEKEPTEQAIDLDSKATQPADHEELAEAASDANHLSNVSPADLKQKIESTSKDDANDDSLHQSAKDRNSSVAIGTADHAGKVDPAQLVVAATTSLDQSTPSASVKDSKDEQSVKPVGAVNESTAASFARLTRAGASIGRESGVKPADDLPPIDPARFIGRVAKAFQTAQDRGGTLQIRLSPPELGALRLELTVKDGAMSASLQTENSTTRRLLLDHLPALRDRLAEQNIRVDRFDVDVRRDGNGSQSDARGSQHQQFQQQPDQPSPRRPFVPQQPAREPAVPDVVQIIPNVNDAGLNLIV